MKKTEEEIRQEVERQFSSLMERAEECSPGLCEALRVYGNLEAAWLGDDHRGPVTLQIPLFEVGS